MARVLLIEDDLYLGEAIRRYLTKNGHSCELVEDDREVMAVFLNSGFDIVVLDLILKFSRGEDILRQIKAKQDIPVIILTAKGSIEDKEVCFGLGADDYITKPFNPKELLLRIEAVLKRNKRNIIKFGSIEIDLKTKILKKEGKPVYLTKKEWELLEFFINHSGKVVDSETILVNVWPDSDISSDSIRVYVKKLRDILGKDVIKTLKGRGYLFLVEK
ncbi:response regulator transcription factor [Hippea jasoniae]|uniref:response regulator transcription factor n=1 Tax=Hippea jasoniae TaxID=944479 RepID=UPI0005526ACE|nr:response regulator transcription factor [Hippea jasoniae]